MADIVLINRPHKSKRYIAWPNPKPAIVPAQNVRAENGQVYCAPSCAEREGVKVSGEIPTAEFQKMRASHTDPGPRCPCGEMYSGV